MIPTCMYVWEPHTSDHLKHYIQNKSDGNQIGALATIDESGELQFHTAAFERLFVSLYYERDKGGAHIGTSTYTNSKRMQGLARSD